MTCSTTITPDSPKTDSLIMEDEHLDTIPETESDEFIKSSVEDLIQNPSESEDEHLDFTPKDVRFDVESYLLESLVNRDTLMAFPPKIDFLLDEFAGELTHLQSIPPGIDNINLDSEADILFLESLLYDNSSPQPPEAFQDNSNTIIESLPTFPIPVEDSDSLREEIDIFFGDSTINVVEDIPVDVPNILPTHPAFNWISIHSFLVIRIVSLKFLILPEIEHDLRSGICIEVESTRFLAPLSPVINTLLPFSSENEDKVFNHGVLAYKEKSPSSKNSPKPSGLKLSSFS
ncbi:hypothetical protein Tco_1575414 [Tanacetum coccineum]